MSTIAKKIALILLLLSAIAVLSGCKVLPVASKGSFSQFVGLETFSNFERTTNESGETILLSPTIPSRIAWNELIVSWNADAPAGTFIKIEASATLPAHQTKFYTLGNWSLDGKIFPRTSVHGQKDADGNVDTDTLILNHPDRKSVV